MDSLQKRIEAYADASANLLAQLSELDQLRERVKKALPFCEALTKPIAGAEAVEIRPPEWWHGLCCLFPTGILVTGADTGAAGMAHFEPGGVIFWDAFLLGETEKPRQRACGRG